MNEPRITHVAPVRRPPPPPSHIPTVLTMKLTDYDIVSGQKSTEEVSSTRLAPSSIEAQLKRFSPFPMVSDEIPKRLPPAAVYIPPPSPLRTPRTAPSIVEDARYPSLSVAPSSSPRAVLSTAQLAYIIPQSEMQITQ